MGASRWLEANKPVGTSMHIDMAMAHSDFDFFMITSSLSEICGRSMEDPPLGCVGAPSFDPQPYYERSS
jgi:hypothetical protein